MMFVGLGLLLVVLLRVTRWPDLDDERRAYVVRQNRGRR